MDKNYKLCAICGVVLKADVIECLNCKSTNLLQISSKKLEVLSQKVVEIEEKETVSSKN